MKMVVSSGMSKDGASDGEFIEQHKGLREEWMEKPICYQMANIGSEVSRALKNYEKKPERFHGAFERALELFDLTIDCLAEQGRDVAVLERTRAGTLCGGEFGDSGARRAERVGTLREVCRAREEFCDYFYGGNQYSTSPERMMRYYDQFAMIL